jgi:hypothetical protein
VLTFLILGITVNWCHSFTKLTGTRGKCTATGLLSKLFLLCFEHLYLFIYSSYILRNRLRTTRQTTSSTTSLIASEEARSAAILCITPKEEAQLTVILDTTKCRCLHVFTLDLWSYGCSLWACDLWSCVVYGSWLWMNVLDIVIFEWMCWILWYLNKCVYCVWFCNSSCAGYTVLGLFTTAGVGRCK